MLSDTIKDKLRANWALADTLIVKAYARYYDKTAKWECYIYALNPDDDNEIKCVIINRDSKSLVGWNLEDLYACYDQWGEPYQLDAGHVPRIAADIYKFHF